MVTSLRTYLLLLALSRANGFNVGRHPSFLPTPRTRANVPPLFFTDIEPEISSITISPEIQFNGTSLFNNDEGPTNGEYTSNNDGAGAKRKPRGPQTKTISKNKSLPGEPKDRGAAKRPFVRGHRARWQAHYDELKAYHAEHGHCLVPQKHPPNPKLGLWVMQQRRQHMLQQSGKRSSFNGAEGIRRARLLEEIGFVWRVGRHGPRGAYGKLRRYRLGSYAATAMDNDREGDEIVDAVNFEKYMIEKSTEMSEEDKRAAWQRRFELLR